MKSFILLIFLFVTTCAFAETPVAGLRADAFNLLQTLKSSDSVKINLEELKSFTDTVAAAEKLHEQGEAVDAEQLFSLAILKGKLLLKNKAAATAVAAIISESSCAVFTPLSSAAPALPVQPGEVAAPAEAPASNISAKEESSPVEKISARIVGGDGIYTVRKNDTLRLVASRLGVRLNDLARMNHLKTDAPLLRGQRLKYNNRRIVPKTIKDGIVVNIPDRNLYLFRNGRLSARYPVALGISKKKESIVWRTPVGRFQIVDKKENPTWRIPPSIQKEMEKNGEKVLESIPPGPNNPLGKYALRTNLSGILIHSTIKPASINTYSSHGCIRVMPEDMEQLFKSVSVPTNGEIIYQPVKVEVTEKGRVFLEVNKDTYEYLEDLPAEVNRLLKKHQATEKVSWQKVDQAIKGKTGIAMDVTHHDFVD